jgi:hypothetical protein
MKRLSIATVICFLLVVAGMLWLMSGHFRSGLKASKSAGKTEDHGTAGPRPTPSATRSVQNQRTLSERDDPGKVRQAIEIANVEINFWGRIGDQDGLPIPDVRIVYSYSVEHGNDLGVAWSETETNQGETATDLDGLFAITGLKGHYLTIESLTKSSYVYRGRSALIYNFYGDTPEGKFGSRRDKPVLFAMIHKSAMGRLVHAKGGLHVRGDETPERWNLWQGEPDPNGELAVTLRREPAVLERPGEAAIWSADLQIVGGGIIEAPWDEDVRRAPESGYLATIAYPKADQKQGIPDRSFYLKTADGRFGRIQVQLYARDEGSTARCFITSDMNPRPGSRNLEPTEEE